MSPTALLTVYCLAIVAASIFGGLVPLLIRLTHTRLQVAISLTAGFMFGIALLHMIPHAQYELPAAAAMLWVLIGFLVMFFLERFFSFHTHEVAELDDDGKVLTSAEELPEHDHDASCRHGHASGAHAHRMAGHTPGNKLSWTGAAIGLALHSVIAGIALASAVASESGAGDAAHAGHGHTASAVAGFAVFLVIVLHKPLDALTVITLTASAGFAKPTRHLINGLFALAVPAGVGLFWFGMSQAAAESSSFVGYALAFSAGTFLCVALSDLLPELHFHSHDRGKLSAALIVGVALALVMARAEHALHDHGPGSVHDHANGHPHDQDTPGSAPDPGDGHDDHAGHGHAPPEPEPAAFPADSHDGHDHGDHSGHGH